MTSANVMIDRVDATDPDDEVTIDLADGLVAVLRGGGLIELWKDQGETFVARGDVKALLQLAEEVTA